MLNPPSLFTVENLTVDLSKVTIVAKRVLNPGYWLRVGDGDSIPVNDEVGAAVLHAWIAFAGKFDPQKDR